jgi:hypothetical protein
MRPSDVRSHWPAILLCWGINLMGSCTDGECKPCVPYQAEQVPTGEFPITPSENTLRYFTGTNFSITIDEARTKLQLKYDRYDGRVVEEWSMSETFLN